eukprot:TRINITY_DN12303_c1_g1_i1.p2 TRINITY_DN12303_c1_g1~~TRINITY_DN12303_c1_g1_i1.p2  ORF type:complete len:233 (-),score=-16.02 TRINITY_DN12303_c1_g1_i1:124-822(-)
MAWHVLCTKKCCRLMKVRGQIDNPSFCLTVHDSDPSYGYKPSNVYYFDKEIEKQLRFRSFLFSLQICQISQSYKGPREVTQPISLYGIGLVSGSKPYYILLLAYFQFQRIKSSPLLISRFTFKKAYQSQALQLGKKLSRAGSACNSARVPALAAYSFPYLPQQSGDFQLVIAQPPYMRSFPLQTYLSINLQTCGLLRVSSPLGKICLVQKHLHITVEAFLQKTFSVGGYSYQ